MRVAAYGWTGYGKDNENASLPINEFMKKDMAVEKNFTPSREGLCYYDTTNFDLAKKGGYCKIVFLPNKPDVYIVELKPSRNGKTKKSEFSKENTNISTALEGMSREPLREVLRCGSARQTMTAKYLDHLMKVDGKGAYVEVSGEKYVVDRVLGKPEKHVIRMLTIKDVSTKFGSWPRTEQSVRYSVDEVFKKFDRAVNKISCKKLPGTRYSYMLDNLGILSQNNETERKTNE